VIALQTGRITAPRPLVQRPSPLVLVRNFGPWGAAPPPGSGCGQGLGCL